MKTCTLWPDVKPTEGKSWAGKKVGRLTYIQPIGILKDADGKTRWMYLSECECGNERISRAMMLVRSCGCLRAEMARESLESRRPKGAGTVKEIKARKKAEKLKELQEKKEKPVVIVPPKPKAFNRSEVCIKYPYSCVHYSECQDERIRTRKVSPRYAPGCYEMGEEEKCMQSTGD